MNRHHAIFVVFLFVTLTLGAIFSFEIGSVEPLICGITGFAFGCVAAPPWRDRIRGEG